MLLVIIYGHFRKGGPNEKHVACNWTVKGFFKGFTKNYKGFFILSRGRNPKRFFKKPFAMGCLKNPLQRVFQKTHYRLKGFSNNPLIRVF